MIWLKALPFIASGLIGAGLTVGVMKATQPVLKCPACPQVVIPACPECPPAVKVDLQNFDLSKLNNKKGSFTYAPSLSNVQVVIDCEDSVVLKQILKKAK